MLRFTVDVTAADEDRRVIEGLAVPYGESANLAGVVYSFAPGSVKLARQRVPLLLEHDRARPAGVLVELADIPGRGALVRFKVDATPDGDAALVQAASGSRGGLSIGATVEAADAMPDGSLSVTAASLFEVSLVALPALASASVTRVAATEDEPAEPAEPAELPLEPAEDEPEDEDEDEDEDELAEDAPATTITTAPDPEPDHETEDEMDGQTEVAASWAGDAGALPVIRATRKPVRRFTLGELAKASVQAQMGIQISAALTETISTDVPGVLPPAYVSDVIGTKNVARVLFGIFGGKPIPSFGVSIVKPKITAGAEGAWAANIDADATTSKVTIGTQPAALERWDWAGAISWVTVQQSDPDILDVIFKDAVENFHKGVEAKIAAEITATPEGTATTLGAALGEFYATNEVNPDAIIMSGDEWGKLADAPANTMAVGSGDVSASGTGLVGMFAGIPVYVAGSLPPASRYLATKRAVDVRTTEPVRLSAIAIGGLNVEIAAVGLGVFDLDYPDELYKLSDGVALQSAGRGTKG